MEQEPEFVAWVGIDWADQKHGWCLQAAEFQLALRLRSVSLYAETLLRVLALVSFFSRLAVISCATVFWTFSLSTR